MGKETWISRSEYIHNFARTLAGRLHLKSKEFRDAFSPQEVVVYLMFNTDKVPEIRSHLAYHGTDEMLGRLACCGRGSESEQRPSCMTIDKVVSSHPGLKDWVYWNIKGDAREMLIKMATLTVVAALADNFYADAEMIRQEEHRDQEGFDRAMADYTHYGPNGPQLRR